MTKEAREANKAKKVLMALLALWACPGGATEVNDALMFYQKFPVKRAAQLADEFQFSGEDRTVFLRGLKVWPIIKVYAERFDVDPMIAFRIAATESRFYEQEVGAVGEIGLFQILPSTGKLLWKWYQSSCPEPRKSWEKSVPNQICLAVRHIANIHKPMKGRVTSLRASLLPKIYAIYNGGPTGLAGKSKKNWVLSNLHGTKSLESVALAFDQLRVERGPALPVR